MEEGDAEGGFGMCRCEGHVFARRWAAPMLGLLAASAHGPLSSERKAKTVYNAKVLDESRCVHATRMRCAIANDTPLSQLRD